jgi:hypothetical protein
MEKIEGFNIVLEKSPDKWIGSIYIKSNYKSDAYYVSSSKDSFSGAIQEILSRYSDDRIEGIDIKLVKENKNDSQQL